MANKELIVGNLNCTFLNAEGKKGLFDYWNEFIKYSFREGRINESAKGSEYYFKNIQLKKIDGNDVLIGRFIKNTMLTVEQQMGKDESLIKTYKEIPSAPSCVFVIYLKNHVLLYCGENRGSPSIRTFINQLFSRILKERNKYLIDSFPEGERQAAEVRIPIPDLDFTPLSSKTAVKDSLDKIYKISNIKIIQRLQNGTLNLNTLTEQENNLLERLRAKRSETRISGFASSEEAKATSQELFARSDLSTTLVGTTASGLKETITTDGSRFTKHIPSISSGNEISDNVNQIMHAYDDAILSNEIPLVPQLNSDELIQSVNELP